ncbi:putative ribokinase, partial [Leucoagaricus sp. SymC.cos]
PMFTDEEIVQFPWNKIDWLIVNHLEARSLLKALTKAIPPEGAKEMLDKLSKESVLNSIRIICTLGANGVLASVPGLPIVFVPVAPLQGPVVDTTGAGDTFTGYFVAELMSLGREVEQEADIVRLLRVATRAAAMCVERAGTVDSVPTVDEVERRFGISRE